MLLQSLLRPVLTPLMRGMFDAPIFSSTAWSPLALWPDGIDTPGMWISPRDLTSQWADYIGTTPVVTPGTVADSANPVGLALDIRAGATVLTDPGNHMLQSTSAARPLLSARVNLLTYTEDFSNAVWATLTNGGATASKTPNYGVAPDGTTTACRVQLSVAVGTELAYFYNPTSSSTTTTGSYWLKTNDGSTKTVAFAGYGPHNITVTPTWTLFTGTGDEAFAANLGVLCGNSSGTALSADLLFWHPHLNLGSTALDYQRVNTASDYDASVAPTYTKFDGVDDGMATAAFSAGTLIDGMDCMIAVRRDSAAATYLISDTASRGFFEWESGNSSRPDVSAGTPTYYVDGVAITATQGALFTALTVGDWHILEARGLDLSTWTKVEVSSLVSYRLNGPRGDILLYPSTASTTDKDAARQWLADYYGVTLP